MKKISYTFAMILMLSTLQFSIAQVIDVPADYPTIQQGIDAASEGDTVLVAEGTYVENVDFNGKHLTLASHFILDRNTDHIANTIIDGSDPADPDRGAVVSMEGIVDTTAVLTGFSITGGSGNASQLIVYSTNIGRNRAGAGVHGSGGKVEFNYFYDNHIVSENGAMAMGGGIGFFPSDSKGINLVVRNNKVYDNSITASSHSQGGGIAVGCDDGFTLVENNDIYDNTAECLVKWKVNAGGLMVGITSPFKCEVIVRNNKILRNEIKGTDGQGGGIFVTITPNPNKYQDIKPTMEFYNNIIAYNTSCDAAGAMAFWDQESYPWETPAMLICNNTIYKNKADRVAAIYNHKGLILLLNNIIWDDLSDTKNGELYCETLYDQYGNSSRSRFISIKNVIQKTDNPNNCPDAPKYIHAESFKLTDDSPGIDIGMDAYVTNGHPYVAPRYDIFGAFRPVGQIDAGAVQTTGVTTDIINIYSNAGEKIKILTNPFADQLIVEMKNAGQIRNVTLYNMSGQLERRIEYPKEKQLIIQRDALPPGMYILRVEGEGVFTGKVIAR